MSAMKKVLSTVAVAATMAAAGTAANAEDMRIALVVKALGIGFFEAAAKGAEEAAAELGDTEIIYTGPTDTTAEGQIEVINSLIAQGVDAIAISANDPDALVPSLKKAMQRGITVISWDSGVAEEGRQMHLNPSSNRADRQHDHQAGRRSHARRRRSRGAVGLGDRDQPEHLDRRDEQGDGRTTPASTWWRPSMATTWRTSPTAKRRASCRPTRISKAIIAPTTVGIVAAARRWSMQARSAK